MKSHLIGPSTERLELRAIETSDAEALYQLCSHPDVMRYTGEEPLGSLEEAEKAIAEYPDFETVGYGRWGCVLKGQQTIIGFCGLKYLPEFDAVDLGYRFLPEHWGQGLATEACRVSLQFGFEVLGLNHIMAMVLPENLASIRVLEKIGMQHEGKIDYEGLRPLLFGINRPKPHRKSDSTF